MQTPPPPVHTTSDFHCTSHSLIAIPQGCGMAQYNELRPYPAASDDTVKDAAAPEPVVVAAETVILKQQYPWSFPILVYE